MTTTSPRTQAPPQAGRGVHATARIRATSHDGVTVLPLLRSDGPFHLRQLRNHGSQARVCVVSAMSAPLGGDRLAIDVSVEAGAQLEITTAAATLALRGATTDHATYDVTLTVGEQATLYWLPQPLISTRGSNLRQTYTVDLAPTARLILREELILGRAHEPATCPATSPCIATAAHCWPSTPRSALRPPAGTVPPSWASTALPARS